MMQIHIVYMDIIYFGKTYHGIVSGPLFPKSATHTIIVIIVAVISVDFKTSYGYVVVASAHHGDKGLALGPVGVINQFDYSIGVAFKDCITTNTDSIAYAICIAPFETDSRELWTAGYIFQGLIYLYLVILPVTSEVPAAIGGHADSWRLRRGIQGGKKKCLVSYGHHGEEHDRSWIKTYTASRPYQWFQ